MNLFGHLNKILQLTRVVSSLAMAPISTQGVQSEAIVIRRRRRLLMAGRDNV